MISGVVSSTLQATLEVPIEDQHGHLYHSPATIDAGCTLDLTLPPLVIARLGLVHKGQKPVTLGDGTTLNVEEYTAVIHWDMQVINASVWEIETYPLVGTGLLNGFQVTLEMKPGGNVTLEAMP